MGMLIYDALVLAKVSESVRQRRRVLTLGVPTFAFSAGQFLDELKARDFNVKSEEMEGFGSFKDFFLRLGFEGVDALDVSDYEGADIVDDLNDPGVSDRHTQRYDLIYDTGTIEHIFDAPTALRTIVRMLNVGGVVVHASPANGFMDHGFWQLSPDLFRTFYQTAGFRILTSALYVLSANPKAIAANENIYRTRGRPFIVDNIPAAIVVFAAQKQREVYPINVRLQDYYSGTDEKVGAVKGAFFLEFETRAARPVTLRMKMRQTQLWAVLRIMRNLILGR